MSRDDTLTSSGSIARDVDETLDPPIDTSFASVVCRGAKTTGPILIERWIEGPPRGEFAALTIAAAAEPCLRDVDVIPTGRLAPGVVEYRVVPLVGGEIVAQERRALRVGAKP